MRRTDVFRDVMQSKSCSLTTSCPTYPELTLALHSIIPAGHVVGEVAPARQYEPFTKDNAAQEKVIIHEEGAVVLGLMIQSKNCSLKTS
jgi:hypothetical protein